MKINNAIIPQKSPSFVSVENIGKNTIIPQKSPSFGSNEKMAKNILSGFLSKLAKSIEFNSMNMSFPVLLTVMFGGVLAPRITKAQDKYDREEILRRDSISITTIAFGAPVLSKMFSKFNEMKTGLVLTKKPTDFSSKNIATKVLNYLRPINGVHVLSSSEIVSKYSNIENYNLEGKEGKKGVAGFCEFINTQNGNLKKLFGSNEQTKLILEDLCTQRDNHGKIIKTGKEVFANANNESIIKAIENASKEKLEELCTHFKGPKNEFVKKAKSINSAFGFISMILLVPLFLGILLPKWNEKITKRKITETKNPDLNAKQAAHHQIYQNPYFMASEKKDKNVFNSFNKNN